MENYREYLRATGVTPQAHELMLAQLCEVETIYARLNKLELAAEAMGS